MLTMELVWEVFASPYFWIILMLYAALKSFFSKPLPMEHFPGEKVTEITSIEQWYEVSASVDTSDKKDGRLIVLDAFATWCPPCVKASPIFGRISAEYAEESIRWCP